MMKKISLTVLGMLAGVSSVNAQMTWNEVTPLTAPFACVGNDCTLATGSSYTGATAKVLTDNIGTAGDQATLTIEGESSGGAGDQAVFRYEGAQGISTTWGTFRLTGTNYLDIINNGDIEATQDIGMYLANGSMSGDFTNNGRIHSASTYAISGSSFAITGDFLNSTSGTILSDTSTALAMAFGVTNMTNEGLIQGVGGLTLSGGGSLTGSFLNSGTIDGTTAWGMASTTISGNFTNTGSILSASSTALGAGTIGGDFLNETGAVISGGGVGINGARVSGDFINRGDITAASYGILMQNISSIVAGTFTNDGTITSTSGHGIYTWNSSFQGDFNNEGTISALTAGYAGLRLTRDSGSFGIQGVLTNNGTIAGGSNGIYTLNDQITGGIVNNGTISGGDHSAIWFNGTLSNTLDYSGTGDLISGGGYADFNMAGGTDTLNIANATLTELSASSVETITIMDSTLTLNITDLNKTNQIITTAGTTSLSLMNVIFDFDSTAAIITGGTDLLLMQSTSITDLGGITANLSGGAFGGVFSIVDNGGIDELHFIAGGAAPVAPPAAGGSTFAGGSVVATQMGDLSQQAIDQRLQKKRLEFAALYSDSMYSIYEQPRSQVWAQGFGLSGSYEGDAAKDLAAYDTTLGGAVIGYDYNWGILRTGIAGTYATGSIEGDANAFEIDVESFTGSLYSVIDFDKVYIETAASYGTTTFDQNLSVNGSSYDSENMGALLRVGMKLHAGNFGLEPFAGLQYKNVIVEEHFNGVDTVAEYNQEMVKAELGFTTSYQMMLDNGDAIVPYLRLETGHDFSDNATLTSLDGTGLVIGNPASVDLGNWVSRAATGVSLLTRDNYSISGEYEYEFRDKYEAHIGKIKGRLMF